MSIFPFTHETLMTLNIILSAIHALLSFVILIYVSCGIKLPGWVLPAFLVVSIIVCILILLYSIDCINMKNIKM